MRTRDVDISRFLVVLILVLVVRLGFEDVDLLSGTLWFFIFLDEILLRHPNKCFYHFILHLFDRIARRYSCCRWSVHFFNVSWAVHQSEWQIHVHRTTKFIGYCRYNELHLQTVKRTRRTNDLIWNWKTGADLTEQSFIIVVLTLSESKCIVKLTKKGKKAYHGMNRCEQVSLLINKSIGSINSVHVEWPTWLAFLNWNPACTKQSNSWIIAK